MAWLLVMDGNMEGEKMCQGPSALLMKPYDPHRIKGPLKRTNPQKGRNEDSGWVEISWDEDPGILAEKLREVSKKDPRLVGCDQLGPQGTESAPARPGPSRTSTTRGAKSRC